MAVRMNLWSLTLIPGEPVPLYVRRDFQITNAALGEELRSTDGRSVVKVTHHPIPASAFDTDSEYDSEDFDEDDDEEDEEDDEEEEVEAAAKANGIKVDEEDDDEDDDEEDDDEEDFSDDEIEETSVLCSLTAGKIEQAGLNLTFVEGEVVIFEVTGENSVHLLGNYINQFPDEDSDYDSEEDDYSDLELDDEDEFSVEEFDEEVPKGKITEIAEPKVTKAEKKPAAKAEAKPVAAAAPVAAPKRKADEIESPAPKAAAATETLSKAQKKKLAKKARTEETAAPAPAPVAAAAPAKESKKKTLPSGLVIEDIKTGDGPVAKSGKRLGMRYIGKLESGKQFDANTGGKPFSFVLGRGEVIQGWDQGLAGMAVGGERRLTIPAKLAYGSQRIPGIPPNSTLKFDVKLVSVN